MVHTRALATRLSYHNYNRNRPSALSHLAEGSLSSPIGLV
jgi:hypothetical protein